MKVINEMRLDFPGKTENEAFARTVISAFVVQLNPTIGQISDIKTAVSEAVTNAIVHGYAGKIGTVRLAAWLYEDRQLIVEVCDAGHGIENIELARQPFYTSRPEMERSGMGFTVMETFMDDVTVISRPGRGTTIRMSKVIEDTMIMERAQ